MERKEPGWIGSEPRAYNLFESLLSFIDETFKNSLPRNTHTNRGHSTDFSAKVKYLDSIAPQQDYLVKLVVTIRNMPLPAIVIQTIDKHDPYKAIHLGLSPMINVWSNFEDDAPLHPPIEERPGYGPARGERIPWQQMPGQYMTAPGWTNLDALIARIHAIVPYVLRANRRGQPLTQSPLDDLLPADAVWIIYADKELTNNDVPYACYPDDCSRRLPWSRGESWTGQHAFNLPRWQFWMRRFREILEKEGISDVVSSAALKAPEAGSSL